MRAVIDCCPRSIRVHADTWMTSWENCFLCFAATWRTDLNMCVWLFRIWKVKARKKNLPRVIYKEEKWRNGGKKSSWPRWSRMSINCKKSLQQLNCDHCVIAVRDLLFWKMFCTLFCFEQQKTSKTLRSNCTQVRWRKKKKQRRQVYITWDLKNA